MFQDNSPFTSWDANAPLNQTPGPFDYNKHQPAPNNGPGFLNNVTLTEPPVDYKPLIERIFTQDAPLTDSLFEPVNTLGDPSHNPVQALLDQSQQPKILFMNSPKESGFALLINGEAMNGKGTIVTSHQNTLKPHELFSTQFQTDAHFVGYGVIPASHPYAVNNTLRQSPRLTKPSLGYMLNELSVISDIDQVVGLMLVVDMDLPGHAQWDTDLGYGKTYNEHFERLAQTNKILSQPSFFYKTRSGARLGYLLSRPVPVSGVGGLEDRIGGLVHDFYLAGIPVDYQCMDWTRLFRANNVTRETSSGDKKITGKQPYYALSFGCIDLDNVHPVPSEFVAYDPNYFKGISEKNVQELGMSHHSCAWSLAQEQAWINKYNFENHNKYATTAPMAYIDLPVQISDAEVSNYFKEGSDNSLFMIIKKKFENYHKKHVSEYVNYIYDTIFGEGTVFLNKEILGGFHGGLLKAARGFMTILLKNMEKENIDVGYTFIYSCVLQAAVRSNRLRVDQNRPDARSTEHLKKEVADICLYNYRNIRGEIEQEKKQEEVNDQYSFFMNEKVNLENSPEDLTKKDLTNFFGEDMTEEHFKRLLILHNNKHGDFLYTIEKSGYGHYKYYGDHELVVGLSKSGHNFIDFEQPKRAFDEAPKARSQKDVLMEHGYEYVDFKYNRIVSDNTPVAEHHPIQGTSILMHKKIPGMRTDIVACENKDVAEWLRLIGGNSHEKLLDWLASFIIIRHPNCALFLEAMAKVGKDLLAASLRALTESRKYADFERVIGDFQGDLQETPFIWLNEGMDEASTSNRDIASKFKKFITDDVTKVNPKGRPEVDVIGYNRFLITGNNDRVLRFNNDLTSHDIEAIADRLLHIKPLDEKAAHDYIKRMNTTACKEKGILSNYWADYVIPGHVMWLYQQRAQRLVDTLVSGVTGSRFLVQGEIDDYHRKMAVRSGNMSNIIEFIGNLMRDPQRAQGVLVIKTRKKELRVHAPSLADLMKKSSDHEMKYMKKESVRENLRTLATVESQCNTRMVPGQNNGGNTKMCTRIDLSDFIEKLMISGFNCDFRNEFEPSLWDTVASAEVKALVLRSDSEVGRSQNNVTPMIDPSQQPFQQFGTQNPF